MRYTVYEFRDADRRSLYIGVTRNWPSRLSAHKSQPWYGECADRVLREFDTIDEAAEAEAALIAEKRPKYNRDMEGRRSRAWAAITKATPEKEVRNFRLGDGPLRTLALLQAKYGVSATAVIEIAIRKLAALEGAREDRASRLPEVRRRD